MYLKLILFACLTSHLLFSCRKFLDVKSDKSQVIPESLQDLQSLLDNTPIMNQGTVPGAGEIASDNLYVLSNDWLANSDVTSKNAFIWEKDVFNDGDNNDWTKPYQAVLYANIVLEQIKKIEQNQNNSESWKNIKGSALFFRAHSFFHIAQQFAMPYKAATAATDMGIPLRLGSDINNKSTRASVGETYDRIIQDLNEAVVYLSVNAAYKTRPSKPAAYALLARTYLNSGDYIKAGKYSDSTLLIYNKLLDYNSLNATSVNPVPRFNDEVIFHATLFPKSLINSPIGKVDSNLYKSYEVNDLRKTVFFKPSGAGHFSFYGSYDGTTSQLFGGIAVDEVYLIRAESYARQNNLAEAMKDLNFLLKSRYKQGTYTPLTTQTQDEAISIILRERRKELVFRGLRWQDLRRLNQEPPFSTTIRRVINSQNFELPPGDKRYTFQIPIKVIAASGMPQNPR